MNFNIDVAKILKVISKDPSTRRFLYVVVILSFIFGMVWVLPNLIYAICWW